MTKALSVAVCLNASNRGHLGQDSLEVAVKHLLTNESSRLHRAVMWLERRSRPFLAVAGASLVLLVGLLDYLSGPEIGLAIFYLLPICLVAWVAGRNGGFAMAVASAAMWLITEFASGVHHSHPAIPFWNGLVRLGFFWIVVLLLSRLKEANRTLADAVEVRTALLSAEIAEHTRVGQDLKENSERELQRIAYDLHDGVCQSLTGIAFKVKALQENLAAESLPHVEETQRIVNLINDSVGQIRHVVRGLAPTAEFSELLAALRRLAGETEGLYNVAGSIKSNRTALPIHTPYGLHLYRIAQEATNNAIKHGRAGQVEIDVVAEGPALRMVIRDNGTGFRSDQVSGNGLGLRTMRYRAKLLRGTLEIVSQPGEGTEVECVVPNAFPAEGADSGYFA